MKSDRHHELRRHEAHRDFSDLDHEDPRSTRSSGRHATHKSKRLKPQTENFRTLRTRGLWLDLEDDD